MTAGTGRRQPGEAKRRRAVVGGAEKALWAALQGERFARTPWHRRVPMGRDIAAYACPAARLVIELDADAARDAALAARGNRVLHVAEAEIEADLAGLLARLEAAIAEAPPPAPRPPKPRKAKAKNEAAPEEPADMVEVKNWSGESAS